jgi:glycosyltransferase involved in cell wall biosynthesis
MFCENMNRVSSDYLITIGIPFYNNEKTLELAIKSVIAQTYKHWELFLLDDGSTDNSLNIAKNAKNSDNRINLISDGMNKGLVYRLNQIIDIANGDFIARMDADDVMLPERCEKQLAIFVENPKIDVVATAVYTIDEDNNPIGIRDVSGIDLKNKKDILKKSLLVHPSILVKKEWYSVNKYDKKYTRAEDFELWCRSFTYTKFYRIKEPLLLYREGNTNVKNYLESMKTLRIIHQNYSKGLLSPNELLFEILKSHFKSLLYKCMGVFNLQYMLTSRRNDSLNEVQIKYIENLIIELNKLKWK